MRGLLQTEELGGSGQYLGGVAEFRSDEGVYVEDRDDTNWTLGSFWAQTTKQVPTETRRE